MREELDTDYVQWTRGIKFVCNIVDIRDYDATNLGSWKTILSTSVGKPLIERYGALVVGIVGTGSLSPLVLRALCEKTRVYVGMIQHEREGYNITCIKHEQ